MGVGLVLEGGGTRGAYTAGVLDVLGKEKIEFPTVYGISCGACTGISYVSGQIGRNYQVFYNYIRDERYLSVASLRRTGNLFGLEFIFGELAHTLLPFDYHAFFTSPIQMKAGTTDLQTGKSVFFGKEVFGEEMLPVQASSALPFVCKIVSFQGHELMDGGCAMPIPIEQSLADGNRLNVIVRTRDSAYRKSPHSGFPRAMLRVWYGDYPNFVETMLKRPRVYNEEVELCRRLEREKQAVIVQPSRPIMVGRYEKDPERLKEIYELGVKDCTAKLNEIRKILLQDKEESVL